MSSICEPGRKVDVVDERKKRLLLFVGEYEQYQRELCRILRAMCKNANADYITIIDS